MTDREATQRMAILDGIARSDQRVTEPERLVDAIMESINNPDVQWAFRGGPDA